MFVSLMLCQQICFGNSALKWITGLIGNTRNYLPPLDLRCTPPEARREPTVVSRTSGVANLRCPRLARREPALTPLATPRAASSVPERPRPAHRELREAAAKPVAAARPARRCPSGRAPPTASCWRPQRSPRHAPPSGARGTPRLPVPATRPARRCRWPRPAHRELGLRRSEPGGRALTAGLPFSLFMKSAATAMVEA